MRTRLAHASTTAGLSLAFIATTLEQDRRGLNHPLRDPARMAHSDEQLTSGVRSKHRVAKNRLQMHGCGIYANAFVCRCTKLTPLQPVTAKETSDEALLYAWGLLAVAAHHPQRGWSAVRQGQGRRQEQGHGWRRRLP